MTRFIVYKVNIAVIILLPFFKLYHRVFLLSICEINSFDYFLNRLHR